MKQGNCHDSNEDRHRICPKWTVPIIQVLRTIRVLIRADVYDKVLRFSNDKPPSWSGQHPNPTPIRTCVLSESSAPVVRSSSRITARHHDNLVGQNLVNDRVEMTALHTCSQGRIPSGGGSSEKLNLTWNENAFVCLRFSINCLANFTCRDIVVPSCYGYSRQLHDAARRSASIRSSRCFASETS